MIIYRSSKAGFIEDTRSCAIVDKLLKNFEATEGRRASPGEERAWQSSLQYVANALDDRALPEDAGVAVEYQIPSCSKRVDVLLSGYDEAARPNLVVIELKQWSETAATDEDGILAAPRYSNFLARGPHPSYQAWSYAELLRSFNAACALSENDECEYHPAAATEAPHPENRADAPVRVKPCAYLHNHVREGAEANVLNPCYHDYLEAAPVFLAGPSEQARLKTFLKRFITKGDAGKTIERVENGAIRPSKALADSIAGMIRGNREFILIDEQKTIYEHVLSLALKASQKPAVSAEGTPERRIVIVKGGPGTGKSVVAVNLLAALTARQVLACYVSKNAAPRSVYAAKLTGTLKKTVISNLFKGSDWACELSPEHYGTFGCILVDEAHRLREKSGLFSNKGENQIRELIRAGRVTVFFIDDDQQIHVQDIGSVASIRAAAEAEGVPPEAIETFELPSQFRCGGSDGYLAWLDRILGIRDTANRTLEGTGYDFRVYDSATELREALLQEKAKGPGHEARLLAGYCWEWKSKKSPDPEHTPDIVLDDGRFAIPWNLNKDGSLWLLKDTDLEQAGCIHTSQGLEMPYVGVIIGPDLYVRNGEVLTNLSGRAKGDQSVRGLKTMQKKDPVKANTIASRIIRDTYRVLMTRGLKGCFIYSPDSETRDWFRHQIGKLSSANERIDT